MKAQASVEYLLIYAFAIAIILSAIGTFTYLNLADPNSKIPEACNFGIGLDCRDFQVFEDGTITLNIKNTDQDWYDIRLNCFYPSGVNHTGAEKSGLTTIGETFEISCGPEFNNGFYKGNKAKIEVELKYHKGLTTFINYRSHDGTVVAKVK